MRIIHYVIFFDAFQDCNIFIERTSISISDECANTPIEIMNHLYHKYYKKYNTDTFVNCCCAYVEENTMDIMEFIHDLHDDEYDNFFENTIDITHTPTFINQQNNSDPTKNDVVYCVFDCTDYFDDSNTYVKNFTITVGDNFDNQIKNLLKNVKTSFIAQDSRNAQYLKNPNYINCHYAIKGNGTSWKKYVV